MRSLKAAEVPHVVLHSLLAKLGWKAFLTLHSLEPDQCEIVTQQTKDGKKQKTRNGKIAGRRSRPQMILQPDIKRAQMWLGWCRCRQAQAWGLYTTWIPALGARRCVRKEVLVAADHDR
jgi:hypothetical protein